MPDLGNLSNMSSPVLTPCRESKPAPNDQSESTTHSLFKSDCCKDYPCRCNSEQGLRFPILAINDDPIRPSRKSSGKSLDDYVKAWVAGKIELGVPETKCFLPFLVASPKLAACRLCQKLIYPEEEVLCSVRDCECAYHLKCAEDVLGFRTSTEFKCPQHACYLCKQKKRLWCCARCHLASHDKCAAFPKHVVWIKDKPGHAICWKHFTDWPPEKVNLFFPSSEWLVDRTDLSFLNKQHPVPTNEIEEVFNRLSLPYVEEEFKIDLTWKDFPANKMEHPVPTNEIEEVFNRLPLPYVEEEFKIDLTWKDFPANKMEHPVPTNEIEEVCNHLPFPYVEEEFKIDLMWKDFPANKMEPPVPTNEIEEVFNRLPLPNVEEEFKIDLTWKDFPANKMERPPYVHIRRNVYLVKNKRNGLDRDSGCTNCRSNTCSEDCVCRLLDRTDLSLLNKQHLVPTNEIEEVFNGLPLPYVEEEFKIDLTWKDFPANKMDPPPYVHIRRNVYLVKNKRKSLDRDSGCTSCRSSTCSEDCVCRVQSISCSKHCHCSDACTNKPFRKEKKIKVVKTEFCGWGVEAAESIGKGDFIIEYIGEVISDVMCTQRLWDMKYRGIKNFYMCEIQKDFTIDATFKGNSSRFLNHSCDPNCILEKWEVEGEIRVGVFAARSIKVGEPLTYDYRFVQFGAEVKCKCGAVNCQGYLGTKKKMSTEKIDCHWGSKRQRTRTVTLAIVKQ